MSRISRSPSLTSASSTDDLIEDDHDHSHHAVPPLLNGSSSITLEGVGAGGGGEQEDSNDDSEEDTQDEGDEHEESELEGPFLSLLPALATPTSATNIHSQAHSPWPFTSLDQQIPSSPPPNPYSSFPHQSGAQLGTGQPPPIIPASSLPHEIVLSILRLLPSSSLAPALRVCKAWCQCGVELLWHKPSLSSQPSLSAFLEVLSNSALQETTFPYSQFVRRLNLSPLAQSPGVVIDPVLDILRMCTRIERLTLGGCKELSADALVHFLVKSESLVALDLTDVRSTNDEVVKTVAGFCPRLQGLNLSGCKEVTDVGVEAVALGCPALRRMKLRNLPLLTDIPVILLSLHCPLLLELDLIGCSLLTPLSLQQLFRTSSTLRELSLHSCVLLSDSAFPPSPSSSILSPPSPDPSLPPLITSTGTVLSRPILLKYLPQVRMFDHLRYLDLTGLHLLTDDAVAGITKHMPRIRNLIVAKCTGLTDDAVLSICTLGRHLHYLHMGHVASITDAAVTRLARSCTRLRYIDLACCNLLTDMTVFELATNVPRLKRIGLVRVSNLTDAAIHALFVRTSLERIHLSYCDNVTVQSIHELLGHLNKLTHLSLTGVPAFRRSDLQAFCRAPPKEFNSHQRQTFCVYSGKGVAELRRHFRAIAINGVIPVPPPDQIPQLPPNLNRPHRQRHHPNVNVNPNAPNFLPGPIPPPNVNQGGRVGVVPLVPGGGVGGGMLPGGVGVGGGQGGHGHHRQHRTNVPNAGQLQAVNQPPVIRLPNPRPTTTTTTANQQQLPPQQPQLGTSGGMMSAAQFRSQYPLPMAVQSRGMWPTSSVVTVAPTPTSTSVPVAGPSTSTSTSTSAAMVAEGSNGSGSGRRRERRGTVTRGNFNGMDVDGSGEESDGQGGEEEEEESDEREGDDEDGDVVMG